MKWLNYISPRIKSSGCREFKKGIINPWRVISDHEYFIFEKGQGALIIDDIEYICQEKSFIIIPPGKRHISYAYSDSILLHWGHFDWVPMEQLSSSLMFIEPTIPDSKEFIHAPKFIPKKILFDKIIDLRVFVLLQQLEMELKYDNSLEEMLKSVTLLEIFLRIFSRRIISKRVTQPNLYSSGEEIRLHLTMIAHEPMDKIISLEHSLRIGGYSYSRQERVFKKVFKIIPYQYITLLRVERIRKMFNDKNMTISDIADTMGFRDLAYFSRYVTKHLGYPPRHFSI